MISIVQIIGKNIAILHSDGLKVYDAIIQELVEKNSASVSFDSINYCTTAFLNASLGKVWMNAPEFAKSIEILFASPELINKASLVRENALNKEKRERSEESLREFLQDA